MNRLLQSSVDKRIKISPKRTHQIEGFNYDFEPTQCFIRNSVFSVFIIFSVFTKTLPEINSRIEYKMYELYIYVSQDVKGKGIKTDLIISWGPECIKLR